MTRRGLVCVCAAVLLASAVPAASRTPRAVARELLAADFAALNRGERSLAAVGSNACLLAESADLALREVLLAGAVRIYERAGDHGGLAAARERLEVLRRPFVTQGDEAMLRLGEFGQVAFVRCPAGPVDVVRHIQGTELTSVRVTRPYWIMKYPLTRRESAFFPPLNPPPGTLDEKGWSAYVCVNR